MSLRFLRNNETEDLNAGNAGYGFDPRLYYVKLMNRTIPYSLYGTKSAGSAFIG